MHTAISRLVLFLVLVSQAAWADTEGFSFDFDGNTLRGVVETPKDRRASALVILIPGHGRTNVAGGQWGDLRSLFPRLGISVVVWDKAGCGDSDGDYDHQQTVDSSADEVFAAIEAIQDHALPGSERIGLWGISRGGWIAPLVTVRFPKVAFWISVSGTDDKETFGYMLRSNLKIEGRTDAEVATIYSEWLAGDKIFREGGSWEVYEQSTQNLRTDPFLREFFGIGTGGEAEYLANQREWRRKSLRYDDETGLQIVVDDFPAILSAVRAPVLAIFGEKDTQVDWRSTLRLYRETIREDLLTIRRFPDGDHNLEKSTTGGFRESRANGQTWEPVDGYYQAMEDWLGSIGVTREPVTSRTE